MHSDEEMKKIVCDLFSIMYVGWTDEDLLLRPQELRHFTDVVNAKVGRNCNSNLVCKFLMAKRKDGEGAFGKERVDYTPILELELKAAGVPMSFEEFAKKVVVKVFLRDNPPDEAERLQRYWDRAMKFCENVRQDMGRAGDVKITDTMVLRTLIKARKAGWIREATKV